MATPEEKIQALSDQREEIVERVGRTMALFKLIDGDEPADLKEDMLKCATQGCACWLSATAKITKMIELHREEQGP